MPIAFRTVGTDDIPALHELVESAYRVMREVAAGWTTEADLLGGQRTDPDVLASIITGTASRMIVVDEDGVVVGCCQLEARDVGTAYLGMLAVRPSLQAHGVGRRIVTEGERVARTEWDATRCR